MGQKVHPTGIRLGIVKEHTSKWYAESKNFADILNTDLEVRDYLIREAETEALATHYDMVLRYATKVAEDLTQRISILKNEAAR